MFKSVLNKIIMRYTRIDYSVLAIRQSVCLEVNPITVNNFAALFTCKTDRSGFRLYDSPTQSRLFGWLRLDTFCFLAYLGPIGAPLLLQCFSGVADTPGISRCLNAL